MPVKACEQSSNVDMRDSGPQALGILMFAPYAYPSEGPESLVTNKLLYAMRSRHLIIDAITSAKGARDNSPSAGIWDTLADVVRTINISEELGFVKKIIGVARNPALSDMSAGLLWSKIAFEVALRCRKVKQFDVILSRCLPYWGHLPAYIYARKFGLPWIACWNDPFLSSIIPKPCGKGKEAPYVIKKYIAAVGNYADWHVFPCERLRKFMAPFFPTEVALKSSIIPHIALGRFKRSAEISRKVFSISHAGTLDRFRDPAAFFSGVKKFIEKCAPRDLSITFVGRIDKYYHDLGRMNGLDSIVKIQDSKPYEESLDILSTSTILLIIEAPLAEGIFLPSKFVDYVQTGRPILAVSPLNGTLNDILTRHGGGIAADVNSPETVAAALEILYRHWNAGTLDESFGSSCLYPMFSEEYVIGEYSNLFKRLIEKKKSMSRIHNAGT
ncbi:MAG: hypothetical protein HZA17_13750 [Nitrospirae bacterium]|nr:hypothetical protein [Nitrospirota bacterium]